MQQSCAYWFILKYVVVYEYVVRIAQYFSSKINVRRRFKIQHKLNDRMGRNIIIIIIDCYWVFGAKDNVRTASAPNVKILTKWNSHIFLRSETSHIFSRSETSHISSRTEVLILLTIAMAVVVLLLRQLLVLHCIQRLQNTIACCS
jgi:hypothetical protein